MTPALLCTLTAAARAVVYLDAPDAPERELEPPHPAFLGFRRMSYIWVEGAAFLPIGDRLGMWLDFMRERGAAGPGALPRTDADGAARALRQALEAALRDPPDAIRGGELRRAIAILDSADDGSEVSDVAWPSFILPIRGYGPAARRLMAAAVGAWPAAAPDDDPLASAARLALLAAVNAPRTGQSRLPADLEPVE